MNSATAFLVYATATLSGFPAQQWSAIEYPSMPICQAQARAFAASLRKPESEAKRIADGVTIKIEPRCVSEPPQFWIMSRE